MGAPEDRDCCHLFWYNPCTSEVQHRFGAHLGSQEEGRSVRRLSLSRVLGDYPEKDRETRPYPRTDASLMGFFNIIKAMVSNSRGV